MTSRRPTMLFVRTYQRLLGGHLKVFDYMRHVAASGVFEPLLWLTRSSTCMPPPELLPNDLRIVRDPVAADAYFVAGLNWQLFDDAGVDFASRPVVNLIQGLRHAIAGDVRRTFLPRPALRICVSEGVGDAVRATNEVCGPLVVIPNGIDAAALAEFDARPKARRVFVAGAKDGVLARAVADELASREVAVDALTELVPREEFLRRLGACRVAVVLPLAFDGFYLPALEAMVLGVNVVIPQTLGTASFCRDGITCVTTERESNALAQAACALLANDERASELARRAREQASTHSLTAERVAFEKALHDYIVDRR